MRSRVAITYNMDIAAAVADALDKLEGLSGLFIGKRVAIKPNETWASRDDLTACTQADTLRAVIRYLKGYFPRSITVTGGAGAGETDEIFRLLGIDRVIEDEGVEFFDHNRPPFIPVALGSGPQKEVMVNPRVLEYDSVVSLAQLKEHHLSDVTLSMKNIAMSFPAADYYGHPRSRRLHPHGFFEELHCFIAGMCARFAPSLAIIAGHPAMTGTGPIGGHTFESGIVIAAQDFVAADAVGAAILGVEKVRHIIEADRLGLGTGRLTEIELAGLSLTDASRIFVEKKRKDAA